MEYTEEFLAEEQRIKLAMDTFTADVRHLRFKEESDFNWTSINDFLYQHNLETTPENLHFGYTSLERDGLLDLMPLGEASPPQPEPAPAPAPTPTVPQPSAMPVSASKRTFVMFRNGQPITGTARSL